MPRKLKGPIVMAIGGLDPSGGAGLIADASTIEAQGGRAQAVATAITVQSRRSVARVSPLPAGLVVEQVEKLFDEEAPSVVKLGMLAEAWTARALATFFERRLGRRQLVIDPVLRSSSGKSLFHGQARRDYAALFELATVVTPNTSEAEHLLGRAIGPSLPHRTQAARELSEMLNCVIVLKGGHAADHATDLVADGKYISILPGARLRRTKRGTGCRFASALATNLAWNEDLKDAARMAKTHVRQYLLSDVF